MGKHTEPEKVVRLLRDAEAELAGGKTVAQVVQKLGISEQTFYRWRQRYGGMQVAACRRRRSKAWGGRVRRSAAPATRVRPDETR
jgi:transposase-like protein